MHTYQPVVLIINPTGAASAFLTQPGWWTNRVNTKDTFVLPGIVFDTGNNGTNYIYVSYATDINNLIMETTNVASIMVDTTPPPNPVLNIVSFYNISATVAWNNYETPPDLAGFRVFISTNSANLIYSKPLTWLPSWSRSYTFSGLQLDTPYFVAIVAVDSAGNQGKPVTPFNIIIPPSFPPAVSVNMELLSADAVRLTWYGYNSGNLIGFSGFKVYYETNSFNALDGLLPKHTLAVYERSIMV